MKSTSFLHPILLWKCSGILILVIVLLFFRLAVVKASGPGDLDLTFNSTGIVTTTIGSSAIGVGSDAVAIQPNGHIVAVGSSFENGIFNFTTVRYTTDGNLDSGFKQTGIVTTPVGNIFSAGHSVAIAPNDKIIVVGESFDSNYLKDNLTVICYDNSGELDTTFNSTGIVTTVVGNNIDQGKSVVVQPDSKILVAGISNNDFLVVRYTITGTLDTEFNSTGIVTTPVDNNTIDIGRSVSLQPDGKIVVAGESGGRFALARYTSSGKLDNSFGNNGMVVTAIGASSSGHSVDVQPDGRIVVAGESDNHLTVVRYTITGTLDTEFSNSGVVTTVIGDGRASAMAVAIQSDGKSIVAGTSEDDGNYDVVIVRYNRDGSLDTTFGGTGIVTTAVGAKNDGALGIAIQPDGKIVVSGLTEGESRSDFVVIRYLGDDQIYLPVILRDGN
jgi:uncharacterized delta-60 repeat protein